MQTHALASLSMWKWAGFWDSAGQSTPTRYSYHITDILQRYLFLLKQQAVKILRPPIRTAHTAHLSAMTGIDIFLLERQVSFQVEY